ncbi:MAG: peptide ABC transporter substrate-binding protein [Salinispira sp.]
MLQKLLLVCLLLFPTALFGADDFAESESNAESDSVFTMSLSPAEIELNPLYSYFSLEGQIYTALHEGLVTYDPRTLKPVQGIAERWEILENGRLYRFFLHPQAHYSNGDKVLSSHFRDTWLKILGSGDEIPFASLLDPVHNAVKYRIGEIDNPERVGITAPSPDVLEVRLEYPAAYFLSILTHQSLVVVHPDILHIRDWSAINSLPVTGPYYLRRMNADRMEFARNTAYWDSETPEFDYIVLEFDDDDIRKTQGFNSSEIQWIYSGFDSSELRVPGSLQVSPQFNTSYYFFSAWNKPFDNAELRKALLMLLPLSEIRSADAHFFPSAVLVPEIPDYPEVTGIQNQDIPAALRILDDIGYSHGEGLPPIHIQLPNSPEFRRVSTIMKNSWEEQLNMSVELSYYEYYSEYQRALENKEIDIGFISWVGDYADPMTFLQLWNSTSTLNLAGFFDPEFDRLLEESNGLEGSARYEQLAKAEEYVLNSAIVLPVSHSPSFHVINLEEIGGWYATILDVHPFKYFYKKKLVPPPNIARGSGHISQ